MKPIEYSAKHTQVHKQRTDCLVVPYDGKQLNMATLEKTLLQKSPQIKTLLSKHGMSGHYGQTLLLQRLDDSQSKMLIIGIGENPLSEYQFEDLITRTITLFATLGAKDAFICINDFSVQNRSIYWKIRYAIQVFEALQYRFDKLKTNQKTETRTLTRCFFHVPSKTELSKSQKAIEIALAIATGVKFAKDLANTPANICTPTYLANEAKLLAKHSPNINCAVLDEKQIKALNMGLFLSVTHASQQAAKLITLEYRNAAKDVKPVVLVGKGITFDTGGNTIKIPPNMIGMKYDMCGAATVLGVFKAVSELALPINLIGVIPSCENSVGSNATKPEDIVKSMSGHMVEILNTDAEGRLILADALTYCERFHPAYVIDIATLTGACLLALGPFASGLMGNHDPLIQALNKAGVESYDRVWNLPLWNDYHEALRSEHADFSNVPLNDIGGRTIVAGCFLSKFAKKFHWAHLDVANTASINGGNKRGATGRPIPLLVQFLIDHCIK